MKKISWFTIFLLIAIIASGWILKNLASIYRPSHILASGVTPTIDPEEGEDDSEDASLDTLDASITPAVSQSVQDNDPKVKYKGTWRQGVPGGDGTYARSGEAKASARLKFKGDSITVVLRLGPNAGKAKIIVRKIGGAKIIKEVKDLYKSGAETFQSYTYPNLDPDLTYRVRVKVLGSKNNNSSDSWVGLDKFEITGASSPTVTPAPTDDPEDDGITDAEEAADEETLDTEDAGVAILEAGGGETTIEETDSKVKYKGTWTNGTDGSTTYKRSNIKKNNARIKFKAKSVKVILRKSPDAGKVRVVLRNLKTKTKTRKRLNLYDSGVGYTADEIFFDNLDDKVNYRVRVYVIGKHKSPSTGNYVGLDKFIFTGAIFPSDTPGGPTPTPGGGGGSDTTIPIGTKDSLTINIGGGGSNSDEVNVRFALKVFGQDRHPDIKVRLKVTDLVAQLTPIPTPAIDTCQNPGGGEYFMKNITMTADSSGVYTPKPGTTYTAIGSPGGAPVEATVSSDGYVALKGVAAAKAYSLSVKGEKQRSGKMVDNITLQKGTPTSQNFDWTGKPLDGGDLPDPSNNFKQDCIVNAADVSLMKSRLTKSGEEDIRVADLDYNQIINSSDNGIMVVTLSTKPDDE